MPLNTVESVRDDETARSVCVCVLWIEWVRSLCCFFPRAVRYCVLFSDGVSLSSFTVCDALSSHSSPFHLCTLSVRLMRACCVRVCFGCVRGAVCALSGVGMLCHFVSGSLFTVVCVGGRVLFFLPRMCAGADCCILARDSVVFGLGVAWLVCSDW